MTYRALRHAMTLGRENVAFDIFSAAIKRGANFFMTRALPMAFTWNTYLMKCPFKCV